MQCLRSIVNELKIFLIVAVGIPFSALAGFADPKEATIVDESHYSNVFGETRYYRVFLPPGYSENADKKYPVIYFFHGWSQRYFGSSNPYGDFDKGEENGGDNIANFVSQNEVIVVKADGYNRAQDEPYYVRPYNVLPVETYRQFPIYFPELVEHIDAQYRTIADREHRGIAGLSMGGFMTFWIGGKYPHLLSAAGNFCGSPEFVAGPKDFPVEYSHLGMYKNYGGMNVRLHYGDKDFIRGYHKDLNKVWLQVIDNYTWKVFDAAHSTCGMGEMLGFILKTFDNPPAKPSRWHHNDVYPVFNVWDYKVKTDRTTPGFTMLENVDERGLRCAVREFVPDGQLMPSVKVTVITPPIYEPNQLYTINDIDITNLVAKQQAIRSDDHGSLTIDTNGGLHEIGINRKADIPNLSIAYAEVKGAPWASIGDDVLVTVKIVNKGLIAAKQIQATLSATRPSATIVRGEASPGEISVNGSGEVTLGFRVTADSVEIERFKLTLRDDKKNEWIEYFEVPLRKKLPEIKDFVVADGRNFVVASSGNSADTLVLGHGNGDGIPNPGESIVILIKDQGKLWRTDLAGNSKWINPFGINVRKSDNWAAFDHVGGSAKYDIPLISSDCPQNQLIDFFVEYWLPEYPLHIIKRGIVKLRVKGKDLTPPALGNIQVKGDNVVHVSLLDGSRITRVTATLTDEKNPDKSSTLILVDDGTRGDRAAGDLTFSGVMEGGGFGIFHIKVTAEDSLGNKSELMADDRFVLH